MRLTSVGQRNPQELLQTSWLTRNTLGGQSTLPRYDVLCKVFNVVQTTDFLMATIASDLAFYHVTIATTQLVLDSLHDGPFKPSRVMLYHRGLALANLRKRLSEEHAMADPIVMCTTLSLALQEVGRQ